MSSMPIPIEVRTALVARNPFTVTWEHIEDHRTYLALPDGPPKETALRLITALEQFPPSGGDFDIVSIKAGLAGTGFRLTIATGTHIRVTVTAQYREFQRVVEIQEFDVVARRTGKLRAKKPKAAGE